MSENEVTPRRRQSVVRRDLLDEGMRLLEAQRRRTSGEQPAPSVERGAHGVTGDFTATCHVCGVRKTYVNGQRADSRCPHRAGVDQPPTLPGAVVIHKQGVYTAFCLRCGTEGKAWCWRSRNLAVIRKNWDKHEHHHDIRPAKQEARA